MSEKNEITVVDWIGYDDAQQYDDAIGGMGGWVKGTGWDEFIDRIKDEYKHYYEAVRASVIDKQIRRGGFWHQQSGEGVPLFSDNTVATFSMRAWGDLIASIWNSEEGTDFSYIHFAWYTEEETE